MDATMPVDLPHADDRALPCRPTVACTAELASPGTLEVEVGGAVASSSGDGRAWTYPFLLKQTLGKVVQLQAGSNGYTVLRGTPTVRFLDNLGVGPKLHLLDQTDLVPAFALSAQVGFPVVAQSGRPAHDDAYLVAYVTK